MRIEYLRCEGFRSYRGPVELSNLGQVNAIVGKNNSGKSNLLELLKFLRTPAASQPQFEASVHRGLSAISAELVLVPDEGERRAAIAELFGENTGSAIGVQLSGLLKEIRHRFTFDKSGLKASLVTISNVRGSPLLVWHAQLKPLSSGRPNLLKIASMDLPGACRNLMGVYDLVEKLDRQVEGNQFWSFFDGDSTTQPIPRMVLGFYSRIHWVDAYRRADPALPPQERGELSSSGQDLAQVLNHLASDDPARLSHIREGLSEVVRGVSNLAAPLRDRTNATIRFGEGTDQHFNLPYAATGTHQAAIILTKLETGPKGGVFLVEEPESHLHPGAQRRLRRLLERESSTEQIFLTTHSTIFGLAGGATVSFLVSRKDGVSVVADALARDDSLELLLELGHSHTDLLGSDALVCLEGDSEMIAVPRIATALGIDLTTKGVALFNLHGRSGVKRLKELLTYVQTISVQPFLALDNETDVPEMVEDLIRRSLLSADDFRMWSADFEDLFDPSTLSLACSRVGIPGVTPGLFGSGMRAVQVIDRLLRDQAASPLDKPALAAALAGLCEADPSKVPEPLKGFLERIVTAMDSRLAERADR